MGHHRSWAADPPRGDPHTPHRAPTAPRETGGRTGPARPLTCLDLFCGCGGFALGMERAGFRTLAAVDVDPVAVTSFRCNFPHVACVLQRDLTTLQPAELDELLRGPEVDVIVVGPPCQGFSSARRRDGSNHGHRLKEDPRRYLYRAFLDYVGYFRPRVFVMENVRGIKTAAGGEFHTRVHAEARALGYRVLSSEIRAWQYGVPQKRIRQFIIGTRCDLPLFVLRRFLAPTHGDPTPGADRRALPLPVTLGEAIGDLPPLAAGEGAEEMEYDLEQRRAHLARYGDRYLERVLGVHLASRLTAHTARPHSERDLRDFARLREGETSAAALRRGVRFEWPYSKEHFKDRYTRQSRDGLCSTIVAHLSRDGLMFIHPTQNRSLTPREAARVQSFPDWFRFPVARTHQYRLIGNAVPPVLAEAVGRAVRHFLAAAETSTRRRPWALSLPRDVPRALEWLRPLVKAAEADAWETLTDTDFKRGWFALGFLHYRLHPDSMVENARHTSDGSTDFQTLRHLAPELVSPVFTHGGLPVKLAPVVKEAFRRFSDGRLEEAEFYCSEAFMAGAELAQKEGRA